MANNGWRDDERRRWDQNTDRLRGNQFGSPDWQGRDRNSNGDNRINDDRSRSGGDWQGRQDEYQGRQGDQGRESDYSANYASQRNDGDNNLNHRPGGMRDQDYGTDRNWSDRNRYAGNRGNLGGNAGYNTPRSTYGSGSYGSSGNYGTSGNYGPTGTYGSNYPSDYQDYGDWQGQGSNDYPRFGNDFNPNAYARGGSYGRNYTGADFGRNQDGNNDRNFWNKATDEVASWAGDQDAQRRRDQDRSQSHYGRGPKGYTRSDDRIRDDVHDRLTDDYHLDATNIEVAVKDGEVTLNGTVDSRDDKHRAEHIIESLSGVRHVQNNLRINESWRSGGATNQHVGSGTLNTITGASNSTGPGNVASSSASTQGRQGSAMGSANPTGSTSSVTGANGTGTTGSASSSMSSSSTDR